MTLNEPVFLARSYVEEKSCLSVYRKESETWFAITTKNKDVKIIIFFRF